MPDCLDRIPLRSTLRFGFPLILSLTIAGGCRNACQQLCADIAQFAEDECGYTLASGELRECISDHSFGGASEDQREICQEFGDQLDEEWTCEDLELYFQ